VILEQNDVNERRNDKRILKEVIHKNFFAQDRKRTKYVMSKILPIPYFFSMHWPLTGNVQTILLLRYFLIQNFKRKFSLTQVLHLKDWLRLKRLKSANVYVIIHSNILYRSKGYILK